jgi:hypothetical protein
VRERLVRRVARSSCTCSARARCNRRLGARSGQPGRVGDDVRHNHLTLPDGCERSHDRSVNPEGRASWRLVPKAAFEDLPQRDPPTRIAIFLKIGRYCAPETALIVSHSRLFNVQSHHGAARIKDQSRCLFLPQIIHRMVDKSVDMPVGRSRSGAVSLAARRILSRGSSDGPGHHVGEARPHSALQRRSQRRAEEITFEHIRKSMLDIARTYDTIVLIRPWAAR